MKYKKIVLIGMMGCGKSSISKLLATKINYKLTDLDEIFEIQEKISIKDFFEKFGEENFRIKETENLKSALNEENVIISTGGGVILKKENKDLLFQNNILTIYLKTNAETIYNRIKNDTTRPLLQVENPKKEIENILAKREKDYSLAKITIETDNKTKEEIVEEIIKWIK